MSRITVIILSVICSSAICANGSLVIEGINWKEEKQVEPLASVLIDKPLQLDAVSFCFKFQILGRFGMQMGFSAYKKIHTFAVWFRFQDSYGFLLLNDKALIFNIPTGVLRPHSWYHFCSSVNQTHYKVAGNGKLWFENKILEQIEPEIYVQKLVVVGHGINGKYIFSDIN